MKKGKMKYDVVFANKLYEEYKKCWKFNQVDKICGLRSGAAEYVLHKYNFKLKSDLDNELLNKDLKICSKCNLTKPLLEFYKEIGSFGDRSYACKKCMIHLAKKYYFNNTERKKDISKKWAENNIERSRQIKAKSKKKNKSKLNEKLAKKRKNNIQYRLSCNLRTRIYSIITKKKAGSSIGDLGCSMDELKQYLESKFYKHRETGEIMTWDNYGLYGWHIDHIKPLVSFDLTNREQFLVACHYINLQLLWSKDNLAKGAKISEEFGND